MPRVNSSGFSQPDVSTLFFGSGAAYFRSKTRIGICTAFPTSPSHNVCLNYITNYSDAVVMNSPYWQLAQLLCAVLTQSTSIHFRTAQKHGCLVINWCRFIGVFTMKTFENIQILQKLTARYYLDYQQII
ncbi:Hypothetical_protein [Hexamita inflata]|uniref:Hypothetical_protein n=1 Tax=Hexamita inflata TaxID=28002 RepID=A0AA86RAK3_9EUKA|nr:Hypothetical protein HINF_LOCUS62073 [Hexamita inflata]CAI9974431.1 Hypothetical protein HINF_LOCUS62076 [Hexamita inflata]